MLKGVTKYGWDVMCNVNKIVIDVEAKSGYLYLPEDNCPDMKSTINCFCSADPECNVIYTFINNKPDTIYVRDADKWVAKR